MTFTVGRPSVSADDGTRLRSDGSTILDATWFGFGRATDVQGDIDGFCLFRFTEPIPKNSSITFSSLQVANISGAGTGNLALKFKKVASPTNDLSGWDTDPRTDSVFADIYFANVFGEEFAESISIDANEMLQELVNSFTVTAVFAYFLTAFPDGAEDNYIQLGSLENSIAANRPVLFVDFELPAESVVTKYGHQSLGLGLM